MISVRQLSKHYGDIKAVDQISFEVNEHENLILLGTSGCGKTTTLKMLNRLIEPTSGEVFFDGKNINAQSPENLRRGIGYVLQNTGLFPHYTIAENIGIVPRLLKWDKVKIESCTQELLEKLHLPAESLHQYPSQLSGGQQQRVGLARALIADPPVLLMDEPFGALDNITRAKIQAEFKELDELTRKTIIMVTHDVQEAFELADRICLMDQGHIIQIGTPQELLFKPANNFVKQFLDAQRVQLEFKTVTIGNLWDRLPEGSLESVSAVLNHNTSVWASLAAFENQTKQQLTIQNAGATKNVTFEQLMSAFHQYQQRPQV
ncbi:ABC transporter ATP-binding protein [Mucilaginibacter polytrichastri]|uniref:Glycine betaine/carnitine/choline transport ATP-binding protein OpuCA n=1 Tax=Mucilaginibacter polytrichastri TaxID=1302689 RepID=A0A1Q6A3I0_9SPHI|nr:ABC transporter ATP-binding protein [Mucilaginibacter polytrichastri]OKS88560.1 Glycine betaine/carnitine/choline transport ATP-binding protein OpuCA [Mucilaginibacter polytrichastri]SFT11572.1 osmoprotectant transport system ATP-binding protein [Mucilaginibacter polytrichastri]